MRSGVLEVETILTVLAELESPRCRDESLRWTIALPYPLAMFILEVWSTFLGRSNRSPWPVPLVCALDLFDVFIVVVGFVQEPHEPQ